MDTKKTAIFPKIQGTWNIPHRSQRFSSEDFVAAEVLQSEPAGVQDAADPISAPLLLVLLTPSHHQQLLLSWNIKVIDMPSTSNHEVF